MIQVQTSLINKVARLTKVLHALAARVNRKPVVQVLTTNNSGNFLTNLASIQLPVTLTWPADAKWCRIDVVPDLTISFSRTLTNGVVGAVGSTTLTVPAGAQTTSVNSNFVVDNSAMTLVSTTVPLTSLVGICSIPAATVARVDWTFAISGATSDITAAQYVCSAKFIVTYYFSDTPTII